MLLNQKYYEDQAHSLKAVKNHHKIDYKWSFVITFPILYACAICNLWYQRSVFWQ